jgi:hypothetical protein
MVKFFGVRELLGLLQILGVEEFLSNLIRYTRDDFLRWQQFEKIARVASHSLSVHSGITELWEVLAGKRPGRRSAADVTIFDSVGFTIEDFSLLRYLEDLSSTMDLHREIDLVPMLEDPKDLFGLLRTAAAPLRVSKAG